MTVSERVDKNSARLVGRPYRAFPLIGSSEIAEKFTTTMKDFDCVTYVETVLALSLSHDRDQFLEVLRRIRYADGQVEWTKRNHYMTQWIQNNTRAGWVRGVPALKGTVSKDRILDVVPGLKPRRAVFRCLPKKELARLEDKLETGDIIFFASTRSHLDVFHCGFVIHHRAGILLRHASRSRGEVVEQSLDEFLRQNRMAGVLIARPAERP